MAEHDPDVCFCGMDPAEPDSRGPGCKCLCEKCTENRLRVVYLWERCKLAERLKKADIDVGQLADLLWMEIEPELEQKIERMAQDAIRRHLQGITLRSIVET